MDIVMTAQIIIDNWNLIAGSVLVAIAVLWGWMRRPYKTVAATIGAIAFFVI